MINTTATKALPGVLGVYTGAHLEADGIPCAIPLKNKDGSARASVPHPVLAVGAVRHVGDPVALCDDIGKAVNPMIVRGQVHGGVAQGFGQAILERTAYASESGQLLSGSLMDDALPRASDLPDIEVDPIEVPCASNPRGVKGAGKAGAIGSPPAVINALVDALNGKAIDMPATPERIWKLLQAA